MTRFEESCRFASFIEQGRNEYTYHLLHKRKSSSSSSSSSSVVFMFVDLKNQPLQASQQAPKCLLHTQLLKYVDRKVIWSTCCCLLFSERLLSDNGQAMLLLVEQLFNGGFVVEVSLGRARPPARAKFTHPVPITAAAVGLVESPSPAVRKLYRLYAVVKPPVVLQKSTFCLTSDVLWLKLADQLSSISLFHGSVG
ncbi:hypothetical protein T07_3653 [Trichinella nelsoni]|uniref:Uncharacterized protein n=1 Tax=Trichinella nelsoni TaxID=6336 RepID=A0A0V0S192_9BILA|nr:hypothetical protein T07_3653 [Trichinella nelsoni]